MASLKNQSVLLASELSSFKRHTVVKDLDSEFIHSFSFLLLAAHSHVQEDQHALFFFFDVLGVEEQFSTPLML